MNQAICMHDEVLAHVIFKLQALLKDYTSQRFIMHADRLFRQNNALAYNSLL
jgi:hypothetical protein